MEYLITYGWAILIIAVVLGALFELGVFNGSNLAPQACIAQSGFVCKSPIYTSNGITLTFGQTTGRDYYGNWVFIASQGEALNQNGIPVNFTGNVVNDYNAVLVGSGAYHVLIPGQTVPVDFPYANFMAGAIPSNPHIGTPFAGYVWLGYCLTPCSSPTAYSKVATITIKSTAGFLGSASTSTTSTSTTSSSTTTSTTSTTSTTTSTSTSTTTILYVLYDGGGGYAYAGMGSYYGQNNPLTVSEWVYVSPSTNGPYMGVTSCPPSGCWCMPFLSDAGMTVYGWIWQVNGNNPLSYTVSSSGWHLLTLTYTPGTETFYVDGSSVATGSGQYSSSNTYDYWTTYMQCQHAPGVTNDYLNGYMANVQLYESALSSSQVSALYVEGITGSPISGAGSSGWWTLDNTPQDSVGGNTATTSGVNFVQQP